MARERDVTNRDQIAAIYSHLSAMNELYIYIFISLRFSVLEEGFEMRELVQCSAGARFDSCMKLAIDADVAKEAGCRDEE